MGHDAGAIVRVLVTHCKPGVQLGRASAIRGSVDVDGRDAATNPGDNRQGWLTGGVRLAVNGPGRHVHEVARAGIEVAVVALALKA